MNVSYSVTFETKCWDEDWEVLLKTDRLEQMIARNKFDFAEHVLIINNVSDVAEVKRHAHKAVDRGVLTGFHVAADRAAEAMTALGVAKESFGQGYIYSIAELVGIHLCRTEYLLHFSGDSMLSEPADWIGRTIDMLRAAPQAKVANPMWHAEWPKREAVAEHADFYFGRGFSDQCYLIRAADFQMPIYGEMHPLSARYPAYAGELFEKRVDSWMLNHGHFRLTCKHARYEHENIRRSTIRSGPDITPA